MDQTAKMAKTLSETARMGISAIDMLLTKVENDQMREELLREKRGYEKCDRKAEEIMQDYGATSVWETIDGGAAFGNAGSLSHAWSSIPVLYL